MPYPNEKLDKEPKLKLFYFPRTFAEILVELLATRNFKKLPLHIFLYHGACKGTLGSMECQNYVLYVARKR